MDTSLSVINITCRHVFRCPVAKNGSTPYVNKIMSDVIDKTAGHKGLKVSMHFSAGG